MKYLLSLASLLAMLGCSYQNKHYFTTELLKTGLSLKDAYKTQLMKPYSLKDSMMEATLKISENDKVQLIQQLKTRSSFPVITSKDSVENFYYTVVVPIEGDKEYREGCRNRSTYYYKQCMLPGNHQIDSYLISLDTLTNQLYFKYSAR